MSTTALASSCHWKTIVPFNTNSELSQNRTEKQIMLFKTTLNWLFNDIWCYLVIGSFDWKIGIFQQTVLRGLLYPSGRETLNKSFIWMKIIQIRRWIGS